MEPSFLLCPETRWPKAIVPYVWEDDFRGKFCGFPFVQNFEMSMLLAIASSLFSYWPTTKYFLFCQYLSDNEQAPAGNKMRLAG